MKYSHIFFCLSLLFLHIGCSSDSEDCEVGAIEYPNQQDPIDGTIYKQSALDCRLPKVQTFQFNNFEGAEIRANQNTMFFIPQNTFTRLDGTIIDDEINLSILEMYRPGEIIACQLSTNGLNNTQTVEPLLSESIFYITADYNGEAVLMNGEIMVFVPSENQNLELSVFNSPNCTNLDCQVLWEISAQGIVFEEPFIDASGNIILGYRSFIDELGWFSIARYNPNPETRGTLYNKALSQFSLLNSNVFLLYDSNSTAIGMYSEYDANNEVFSEKYSEIPRNIPANVLFVSKPETTFSFGSSSVITENGKITITQTLQQGTESELIAYINNL